MRKLNSYAEVKAALDEFLARENARLDRYDLLGRRAWLTVDKPEPQAEEFTRILKNLAECFSGEKWKVSYRTGRL